MNAPSHSDTTPSAPAPLRPIPRSGIRGPAGLLLFLLLALASVSVGLGLCMAGTAAEGSTVVQIISVAVIVLLTIYLWRVTRTSKGIVPLLLITGGALFYLTSSIALTTAFCGLLFAIGEGSFLLAVLPRKQLLWVPLIPIVAYAITLALSRDPVGSAAVLIPYPPMLALALGTRSSAAREDGPTRVGVICGTALTLGLAVAVMTLAALYHVLGTLSPEALLNFMEELRAASIEQITSAEIPEGLAPEMVAEMEKMLTYANAENTVNSVFNLLPGLFAVVMLLVSAAVQVLQHATLRTFGFGDSVTDRVRGFSMSLISCVVFLAAYLVVFLEGSEASTLPGTVAQNIYIILLPGLALAGMLRITSSLARKGPQGMGCLFYLFILIPCLLLFAPFLLAAVEVIGHIYSSVTSAFKTPDDDDPFGPS